MAETEQKVFKIAIPCVDCPHGPGADRGLSKIAFSKGGTITYEPASDNECGYSIKVAAGPEAERVRENIINCDGADEHKVSAPGILGRWGLKTAVSRDCPALPIDPTSRRQLTEFFEGNI